MYKANTCEEKFNIFSQIIQTKIDDFLPLRKVKRNTNDLPWVTDKFRHMIKRRQYYFKSGNSVMYKLLRNKINRERKRLKQQYVSNTMTNLKSINPKNWWNNIKSLTGRQVKGDSLLNLAQTETMGNIEELCGKINTAFQNVSSHLLPLQHNQVDVHFDIPHEFVISENSVKKTSFKYKYKQGTGA